MYWTLALSTVNITRIQAVIGYWEWRVCFNFIFVRCADFKEVFIEPSCSLEAFHCGGWRNFLRASEAATSNI